MKRRKRLADGSLGELEDVFSKDKALTIEELQKQVEDLQAYAVQQEYEKLLNQGGM